MTTMLTPLHVRYSSIPADGGDGSLMPYLPLSLTFQGHIVAASGLVDSGAAINVLPYQLGLELGAVWSEQTANLRLGGNLAAFPACPLIVSASIGDFPSVRLAFAWTQAENVPLLLGQTNFFMEFNVCFFREKHVFEVEPKSV